MVFSYTRKTSVHNIKRIIVRESRRDLININTADVRELQRLYGIGPYLAENIVSYRESNGRFEDIQDMKRIKGIGEKMFEKIEDLITTGE